MKKTVSFFIMAIFLITGHTNGGSIGELFRAKPKPKTVRFGPTSANELAVARGLKWIAEHQQEDGSWSFDHTTAPQCDGKCENPGADMKSVNAATALGLMPFFGCGITPAAGPKQYRPCVDKGVTFLVARQQPDGSFYEEGTGMVSHGLAALAITEAYSMTRNADLKEPAQKALDFIVKSQNPDGGWSKTPELDSDLTVTVWQMLALYSGHIAHLKVPVETGQNAAKFLDSLKQNDGVMYLRTPDAKESDATATASGLLCRMLLPMKPGSVREHDPAMKPGVEQIAAKDFSAADLVFNYHATLLLHHYGDTALRRKWHAKVFDGLIDKQISDKSSHTFGSWYDKDATVTGLEGGGRLALTAISVMTLEVYYQYQPIYKRADTEQKKT